MRNAVLVICVILVVTSSLFAQEAVKLDEFANLPCDDYLGRMDAAIQEAHKNPNSKVFVYVYVGKEKGYHAATNSSRPVLPAVGSAKAKIDSMKYYIEQHRRFYPNRFSFVNAGFREDLTIEMWLVPNGAALPAPTQTLSKMKFRKGKPTRFCVECCGQ